MKKTIKLLLLLSLPAALWGQERISLRLEQRPAEELFRYIEDHTPFRVFCPPQYADTLTVSVQADGVEPVALLRTALQGTALKVSQYKNDLFITPNAELITSLPAGYFERIVRREETDATRLTVFETPPTRKEEPDLRVYELDEVFVSSTRMRENVRGTTLGVERLEVKAIKNIPTVFGERDIMRVVISLPGVKTVGEASSGFNVRGGATDQNLILFNGGTIYNPTHLFGFFSAINPEVVQNMELFKSSIPAKYGGRISSVLEINGREGGKEKFVGSASLGLLTSQLTLEGPISGGKTSYLVGGRTTYSDWILKKLPEKSGYRDGNAGFYDLNASLAHKFSNYDNLTVNGYFSRDRFGFNADEQYAYRNANASLKWRHIFSPELLATLSGGYDHYDYTTRNTETPANAYNLSFGIDQYYGRLDFTRYAGSHTIDFGLSGLLYDLNPGHYAPIGSESLVIDDQMQRERALESAVYIGDRWDITRRFSLDLGVRYTMYNAVGPRTYNRYESGTLPSLATITETATAGNGRFYHTYHGPEFRISTRYELADGFSFKAGYNTMRQNIHKLSNTTIMAPTDTWKLSDANIRPQTGSQTTAGLYGNFSGLSLETSVEAYYKTMNDYLDYRSGAKLLMNHHIETDVLSTEGQAYGIELMVRKTAGKLNGWVSYSYSRTLLRQHDLRITAPVNNGDWYAADYDKPHDVKFVGNY
ncbi:MAG: TonB-dependent receptor plug domain-containing protein [Tannerellaceae bacterium]|nr:TonB-dependent receptor plug domain-containing protein [Tannerellaceae bacterium]